jgi:hypothetical protein
MIASLRVLLLALLREWAEPEFVELARAVLRAALWPSLSVITSGNASQPASAGIVMLLPVD